MDANLLKVIEIVITAALTIGGYTGGKALINKYKTNSDKGVEEVFMPRAECQLIHNSITSQINQIQDDIADIKVALTTLVRIEERLIAYERAADDRIELRVTKVMSRHEREFHGTHNSCKVPQLDSGDIILK